MQKGKIYHILSYIPLFFLLSLIVAEKDRPAVRFHCGQGMILTIFSLAGGIVQFLLGLLIGWIPLVGPILLWIVKIGWGLAVLALMGIGIYHAVSDSEVPLPVIGQFAFYK